MKNVILDASIVLDFYHRIVFLAIREPILFHLVQNVSMNALNTFIMQINKILPVQIAILIVSNVMDQQKIIALNALKAFLCLI